MTALLKSGRSAEGTGGRLDVRALFAVARPEPLTAVEKEAGTAPAVQDDPELAALKAKLSELTGEVLRLQTEIESVAEVAFEDGKRAALSVLVRDEEAAMAEFSRNLQSAHAAFEAALDDSHRLGIALAQTALSKILGEAFDSASLVEAILRTQLSRLRQDTVIGVHVSGRDFEDPAAIEELCNNLGIRELAVERDEHMPRGDCRIELRLGHIEAGLGAQWRSLVAFCETLAAEPGAIR
ncbi:MAG: FliH/SctL family protein [Hyphomonas sp.]|nr:FliH/SctL family protein [Hyphomonas sp.]